MRWQILDSIVTIGRWLIGGGGVEGKIEDDRELRMLDNPVPRHRCQNMK